MCGIVGFINCGNTDELNKAVNILNHRGPDANGLKWFKNANTGLGHTRLSIIDTSTAGNQPMHDPVSGNWIIFNGEIYNYRSLQTELKNKGYTFNSNSDTEVILKSYNEWGIKCLDKFNGMFAFAIYNELSGETFLARDRLGIKPLYYFHNNDKLIFSSEIKALLECSAYQKEPDLFALHTTVHFQVSPYTGFNKIFKLPAGHYISFKNRKFEIKQYWEILPEEILLSESDAINKLDELINDSVSLQMIADVPIGSMLSGGLDSSLISVLMQQKVNNPINSFTIKFKKDDLKSQGNVDDSYYAKIVADSYGFNHKEILIEPDITSLLPKLIWHMDEPISDPSIINTYLISKLAKDNGIKVLLSGMGADEVFAGYRSYLACLKADSFQKLPNWFSDTLKFVTNHIPENIGNKNIKYIRWLKQFLKFSHLSQFERHLNIKNSALDENQFYELYKNNFDYYNSPAYNIEEKYYNKYKDISYLTKMNYCDTNIYMCDHNLSYMDKAAMAASVEVRPPLIDHRIIEFLFSLQDNFKINGNVQKYLLKKVSKKYLPRKIIYRSKAPFSAPMRGWLKNELSEMVNDLLSEDSIKKRGFYNYHYVEKLKNDNISSRQDNSQLLWRLMTNEIWFRTYFE